MLIKSRIGTVVQWFDSGLDEHYDISTYFVLHDTWTCVWNYLDNFIPFVSSQYLYNVGADVYKETKKKRHRKKKKKCFYVFTEMLESNFLKFHNRQISGCLVPSPT